LTGAVFIRAEMLAGVAFEVAVARLRDLAGGWLAGASWQAYHDEGHSLVRVGPAAGLSRLVEVAFRDVTMHGESAVMALRWEAAGPGGGLFPVLDADLILSRYELSGTLVTMAGVYRTPLGTVGALLDQAGLHLVAEATARAFVRQIALAVADPAPALAGQEAGPVARWRRVPLVPGQA